MEEVVHAKEQIMESVSQKLTLPSSAQEIVMETSVIMATALPVTLSTSGLNSFVFLWDLLCSLYAKDAKESSVTKLRNVVMIDI